MNDALLLSGIGHNGDAVCLACVIVLVRGAASQCLRGNNRCIFGSTKDEKHLGRHARHQLAAFVFHIDQDIVKHHVIDDFRRRLNLTDSAPPALFGVAQCRKISRHTFFEPGYVRLSDLRSHGHDVEISNLQDRWRGLIRVQRLALAGRHGRNRA